MIAITASLIDPTDATDYVNICFDPPELPFNSSSLVLKLKVTTQTSSGPKTTDVVDDIVKLKINGVASNPNKATFTALGTSNVSEYTWSLAELGLTTAQVNSGFITGALLSWRAEPSVNYNSSDFSRSYVNIGNLFTRPKDSVSITTTPVNSLLNYYSTNFISAPSSGLGINQTAYLATTFSASALYNGTPSNIPSRVVFEITSLASITINGSGSPVYGRADNNSGNVAAGASSQTDKSTYYAKAYRDGNSFVVSIPVTASGTVFNTGPFSNRTSSLSPSASVLFSVVQPTPNTVTVLSVSLNICEETDPQDEGGGSGVPVVTESINPFLYIGLENLPVRKNHRYMGKPESNKFLLLSQQVAANFFKLQKSSYKCLQSLSQTEELLHPDNETISTMGSLLEQVDFYEWLRIRKTNNRWLI